MHECRSCKKEIGGLDNPPAYVYETYEYCRKCMEEVDRGYRSNVDRWVTENKEYKKRITNGTYMKPREDVNGYGKKEK